MNLNAYMPVAGERPLDRILQDGGFCSIFRTIGCIGDSLSSGEFDSIQPDGTILGHDLYEHSWGSIWPECAAAGSIIFPGAT